MRINVLSCLIALCGARAYSEKLIVDPFCLYLVSPRNPYVYETFYSLINHAMEYNPYNPISYYIDFVKILFQISNILDSLFKAFT